MVEYYRTVITYVSLMPGLCILVVCLCDMSYTDETLAALSNEPRRNFNSAIRKPWFKLYYYFEVFKLNPCTLWLSYQRLGRFECFITSSKLTKYGGLLAIVHILVLNKQTTKHCKDVGIVLFTLRVVKKNYILHSQTIWYLLTCFNRYI